ncbi:MAG: ATP-binding cassette domain-containing protein [Candidatus Electrothrix sp. AR4]|nr:ATP-binding cassette domain-containing protein [Candidatus Electrothrix sp. AR4]
MRLACRNLTFQYPDSGSKLIDSLSFSMPGPGFNAVFGPSGVGKTSFARLVAGQISADQGTIHTENLSTILYSYNLERLPSWSSIGRLLKQVTPSDKEPLREELITLFELQELMEARFTQLSLGQQNRINLLRCLVQDFDLLILDESLANVDEKLRRAILLRIKELFPERMFLSISHNLMEVATFCKEILVLGAQSKQGGGHILQGLDSYQDDIVDKNSLDSAMLEIMNVC